MQVIGVAYGREWIRVLDAAPDLRVTKYTATTDSSGQVSGSDFSSYSARFHRALGLWGPGGHLYAQGHYRDYLGASETSVYDRVWYRSGSAIPGAPGGVGGEREAVGLPPADRVPIPGDRGDRDHGAE